MPGCRSSANRLDHDDNWPMRLSMGEQQRLGFARALLAKPDWIFLDEATASLDPEAETELYRILKAAVAECHAGVDRASAIGRGFPRENG